MWCIMINLCFYLLVINYYYNYIFIDGFHPMDNEFISVVILGLVIAINKK